MVLPSISQYRKAFTQSPPPLAKSTCCVALNKDPQVSGNDTSAPLVSIITVVFNAESSLEKTIQSVINQSYPRIEYIVIDGNSTDKTLQIIQTYEEQITYWLSEPDQGLYDAMNKGIALCRGQLVGLLNAGDCYETEAIATVVKSWQLSKESMILTGNCRMLFANRAHPRIISGNANILPIRMIPHAAVFVTKDIYQSQGLFELRFKIASDFDFLCRCYQKGIPFQWIDEILVTTDPRGVSSNYYQTEWDYAQIRLHYGLIPVWQILGLSVYSWITITSHLLLEWLGLWNWIEERRYARSH